MCRTIYNTFKQNQNKINPQQKLAEPLPKFEARYPGVLESILGSVKNKAEMLQLNVVEVAASYYVHLAKSQAFMNGNKRMSVVMTAYFLHRNGFELTTKLADWGELTLFISEEKTQSVAEIVEVLSPFMSEVVRKK